MNSGEITNLCIFSRLILTTFRNQSNIIVLKTFLFQTCVSSFVWFKAGTRVQNGIYFIIIKDFSPDIDNIIIIK